MKIQFDTPTQFTDGTTIPASELASATYTIFIDTVNPPVKAYPVPAANMAAATTNTNGSKHVTVNALTDLSGFVPVAGTTYYVAVDDSVSGKTSPYSAIIPYTYSPVPNAPANFSVVS